MRTTRPAAGGHPFMASEAVTIASNGRRIPQCGTCGKARNAPTHRPEAYGGIPRRYTAPAPPRLSRADTIPLANLPPLAPPPVEVRRDHLALALALDVVLDGDSLDPVSLVYASALRGVLSVPRFASPSRPNRRPAPLPDPDPEPESIPAAVMGEAQVDAILHRPTLVHAPAVVSRARQATKGIRNDKARELATRAIAQGWQPRRTGDGHLRLEAPGHRPITVSTTATGDARSWRNLRAQAKRAGLDVAGL